MPQNQRWIMVVDHCRAYGPWDTVEEAHAESEKLRKKIFKTEQHWIVMPLYPPQSGEVTSEKRPQDRYLPKYPPKRG